jgi:hypothetical protein
MNKMKTLKLLQIMLLAVLCSSSSCEEEEKLPGTKPEILLGKWRGEYEASFMAAPTRYLIKTYEFTSGGGSIKTVEYFPNEDRYEDDYTLYFTDWSYDGTEIHFLQKRSLYNSLGQTRFYINF